MTEREAFLKAVLADPSEANRLPFADWLEDHGEEELARWFRQPHPPAEGTPSSSRPEGSGHLHGHGSDPRGGSGAGYGCADGDGCGSGGGHGYGSGDGCGYGDGKG